MGTYCTLATSSFLSFALPKTSQTERVWPSFVCCQSPCEITVLQCSLGGSLRTKTTVAFFNRRSYLGAGPRQGLRGTLPSHPPNGPTGYVLTKTGPGLPHVGSYLKNQQRSQPVSASRSSVPDGALWRLGLDCPCVNRRVCPRAVFVARRTRWPSGHLKPPSAKTNSTPTPLAMPRARPRAQCVVFGGTNAGLPGDVRLL